MDELAGVDVLGISTDKPEKPRLAEKRAAELYPCPMKTIRCVNSSCLGRKKSFMGKTYDADSPHQFD